MKSEHHAVTDQVPFLGNSSRAKRFLALGLLIMVVAGLHLAWLAQDTRSQPFFDPYPSKTLAFYDQLVAQGPAKLLAQMPKPIGDLSLGARPPLYQLLALPFIYIFGRNIDAMLFINIIFSSILILAAYNIGTLIKDSRAGFIAAIFAISYPPIVNLTYIFRPHSALPALVAVNVWLLILLVKTKSWKVAWAYGASMGFTLLIHPNAFYILPLLSLVLIPYCFTSKRTQSCDFEIDSNVLEAAPRINFSFIFKGLIPGAIVAAIIAGSWYLPNLSSAVLLKYHASMWATVTYGFKDVSPNFWWYARTAPGAISHLFFGLLAISVVFNLVRPRAYRVLITIIFVLAYVGMGVREGTLAWMNFAPVLGIAAPLSAVFLVDLVDIVKAKGQQSVLARLSPLFNAFVVAVFVAAALFNFGITAWDTPHLKPALLRSIGVPLANGTCWWRMNVAFCPNPPQPDDWRLTDVLRAIHRDKDCNHKTCRLVVVSERSGTFDMPSLNFHRIRDLPGFSLQIDSSGFGPENVLWLSSDYVLYVPEFKNKGFSLAVHSFLMDPPDVFKKTHREVAHFSLPRDKTAVLIKRMSPITLSEAKTSFEMLNATSEEKEKALTNTLKTLAPEQPESKILSELR